MTLEAAVDPAPAHRVELGRALRQQLVGPRVAVTEVVADPVAAKHRHECVGVAQVGDPGQQEDLGGLVLQALAHLGPGDRHLLQAQAHRLQVGADALDHAHHGGAVRRVEQLDRRDPLAAGMARAAKKPPRPLGIVAQRLRRGGIAHDAGRQDAHGVATHVGRVPDQRLPVESVRDRLAQPDLIQRRSPGVEAQEGEGQLLVTVEVHVGIGGQPPQTFGRGLEKIELSFGEPGLAEIVLVVAQETDLDLAERRRAGEVRGVPLQRHALFAPLRELERTGPHRGPREAPLAALLDASSGHDAHAVHGQHLEKRGIGPDQANAHRPRGDRLHAGQILTPSGGVGLGVLDHEEVGVDQAARAATERATDRESHVLGVQRGAVVEAHAGPQAEVVDAAVAGDCPGFGERRDDVQRRVGADERVEDLVHGQRLVDRIAVQRIETARRLPHHTEHAARSRRGLRRLGPVGPSARAGKRADRKQRGESRQASRHAHVCPSLNDRSGPVG